MMEIVSAFVRTCHESTCNVPVDSIGSLQIKRKRVAKQINKLIIEEVN